MCIVYELNSNLRYNDYCTLENFLSGAVKLTTNADIDEYKHSEYGIRFYGIEAFSFPSGGFAWIWWNCGNSIMSRKHFERLFSKWYEKEKIKWICYDISVEYNVIADDSMLDIHKHLIEKMAI